MSEALIVLNPREIPECMDAIRALRIPRCFVSYMSEPLVATQVNRVIAESDYDRYVIVSDDTAPTQEALDMVLEQHDQDTDVCVTGYCNLDSHLPFVNLCVNQLPPPPPRVESYVMLTRDEVEKPSRWSSGVRGDFVVSTFAGLALTCMSRDMWLRFPLHPTAYGGQIDYQLSWELAQDGHEIVAPIGAFVHHVKETWNVGDKAPEKQLLVGEREPAVTWEDA